MKSNAARWCIDDFGGSDEHRRAVDRWIVPSKSATTFSHGQRTQDSGPFDQLIIFRPTQPKESGRRRVSAGAFPTRSTSVIRPRKSSAFCSTDGPQDGLRLPRRPINYLISKHYLESKRHALLHLATCAASAELLLLQAQTAEITKETLDFAVENYFFFCRDVGARRPGSIAICSRSMRGLL